MMLHSKSAPGTSLDRHLYALRGLAIGVSGRCERFLLQPLTTLEQHDNANERFEALSLSCVCAASFDARY